MKFVKLLIPVFPLLVLPAVTFASLSQKLVRVNDQWIYNPGELSAYNNVDMNFEEDARLIQKHLLLVHEILSARNVPDLSADQLAHRREGLKHLYEYAHRGLFPANQTHPGRQPVFIDARGVHCAVGYLIKASGHAGLSQHISRNMNFLYLKDMQDEALGSWVANSGFTLDELAWIQPGYPMQVNWEPLKEGVNGPVNTIVKDGAGKLLVGGFFDTAGTTGASNMAQWYNGSGSYDWQNFNSADFNGEITDILYHNNKIYVAGRFNTVGGVSTNSGVVMYDGNQWTSLGGFYIGALDYHVEDLEIYRDTLYAGGLIKSEIGAPEVFQGIAKWDGSDWRHTGVDVQGTVKTMKAFNGKLYVGGNFTLMSTPSYHHIFRLNGNTPEMFAEDVSIPVNDIAFWNSEVYIATDYIGPSGQDTLGLAVYRNDQWKGLLDGYYFFKPAEVTFNVLEEGPNALMTGGNFHINEFTNYGRNLGFIRNDVLRPLGILDSTVTALYLEGNVLYAGGLFTSDMGFPPADLSHIVSLDLSPYLGTPELTEVQRLNVYPNPMEDKLTVKQPAGQNLTDLRIFDQLGREVRVKARKAGRDVELDVKGLSKGTYILRGTLDEKVVQQKLIKN